MIVPRSRVFTKLPQPTNMASTLLWNSDVNDAEIFLAAYELYKFGNHPSVIAVCSGVLVEEPDSLAMRFLLVRSLTAMHRYDEANTQLGECLEICPTSAEAYELLGDLATCRDDQRSAAVFYSEARRLDPDELQSDLHPSNQTALNQSTVAVEKLPAATAAVGCTFDSTVEVTIDSAFEVAIERSSRRFAAGSQSDVATDTEIRPLGYFGQYLLQSGVLSTAQLERALRYHRTSGLRIGAAVIELGFASHDEVEWAALGYHGFTQ